MKRKQTLRLHAQIASQVFPEELIVELKGPRCDLRINSVLRCFKELLLGKQDRITVHGILMNRGREIG